MKEEKIIDISLKEKWDQQYKQLFVNKFGPKSDETRYVECIILHKNRYFEKFSQLRKQSAFANAVKFISEYDLDTHWLRYNLMLIAYFETHPFEKDLFTSLGLDFGSSTRRVEYPGKCSFDWEWLSYQLKSLGYKFKSEDKAREAMVYLYKELAEQGYLEFEYNEGEQDFVVFNVKNPIQKDKQMCKECGIVDEETV